MRQPNHNLLLLAFFLGQFRAGFGQVSLSHVADSILAEGKRLYASERTSWDGTDLFLAKFKDREKLGGYFSYADKDTSRCIFYSKDQSPQVLGSVAFDSSRATCRARVDLAPRKFTPTEQTYYLIRSKALALIKTDTFFKTYAHTDLNLIPLISDGERRVVVLTGPQQNGVIIFGNDYELRFDEEGQLISKQRLHHNILPVNFGGNSQVAQSKGGIHNHSSETGPYITATDICTLMLYEKIAKWETYTVISKDYVSNWDCTKDQMVILTMEAWKRIYTDQEKRPGNH
jgi:hypothetical protein